jgi:hypothetical protein
LLGYNDSSTGTTKGVEGRIDTSGAGKGVLGRATSSSGPTRGVEGQSDSSEGIAILGYASASSGTTKGVEGRVQSSNGYGLFTPDDAKVNGTLEVGGDLKASGTKNFVQTVSTDAGPKQVTYTAIEAGTPRTETNGVAEMTDGVAIVHLPDHFGLVTSDDEPLVVQTTPYADEEVQPQVTDQSTDTIVVKDFGDGPDDYSFAYTVKGVRHGYENQEIVRDAE